MLSGLEAGDVPQLGGEDRPEDRTHPTDGLNRLITGVVFELSGDTSIQLRDLGVIELAEPPQ